MKRLIQKASRKPKFEDPGHYNGEDREKIQTKDFGDPENRKFPIVTQKDVHDAARLIGHAQHPEKVKKHIIEICKRKGFNVPDAWKNEKKD